MFYDFNPRPSREGRRRTGRLKWLRYHISIHAPRGRGDPWPRLAKSFCGDFNPRPSREGRPDLCGHLGIDLEISIHAPRGRGD